MVGSLYDIHEHEGDAKGRLLMHRSSLYMQWRHEKR